jgi:hypothetical protein
MEESDESGEIDINHLWSLIGKAAATFGEYVDFWRGIFPRPDP